MTTRFDAATSAIVIAIGIALVVLARWAARRRGTKWDSLVALRMGDVLFTEVLGAFLIGFAVGSLVAPQLDSGRPPGRPIGPGGRLGLGGDRLPLLLGIASAAIAVLMRIDLGALLLPSRSAPNALSNFIGARARVIAHIPAGGYGEIAIRDGIGNVMSVAATADTELVVGSEVRVVGAQGLNLVVSRVTEPSGATP